MIQPIRAVFKWLAEPVAVLLLAFGATTAIAQPFYVPSGSMEPTLRIGDAMIASKFAYGYSTASLPLQPGLSGGPRFLARDPQQGDVVIFRHPADKATVLVKRVVGLPGDHVQMRQGRLVINGRMLDLIAAGMAPGPEIGRMLRQIEDWWLASGFSLAKDDLLKRVPLGEGPS